MYVKAYRTVNGVTELATYTKHSGLSFAPAADLVGASIPINEFQLDIKTEDELDSGAYAFLYDDLNNLWAKYWVVYAERLDAGTVRLRAQSDVALLERVTLPAVYYSAEAVENVLDDTVVRNSGAVGVVAPLDYTLDSSFDGLTVTGFCPEQTARERLLWVCFTIGAYVKSCFNTQIEILPIDDTETMIPMSDTYWKPSVTYSDWVTGIRAKAYTFAPGTPQTTDEYVTDANGDTYIVTASEIILSNPDAPASAPENIMDVEGVYLLNPDNVSGVLSHLAQWYFPRMAVDFAAIDNAAYIPGDRVTLHTDDLNMVSGYVESTDFAFGVQTKATMRLTGAEQLPVGGLTILYKWEQTQIGKKQYAFPVGYVYSILNPYIDLTMNAHRYIFRPINASATGTVQAGDNENVQPCAVALDLHEGILHVISVDSITEETDEITIGVIA